MQTKPKKCKGIGKAHGFKGCGKVSTFRRNGLCPVCLSDWCDSTDKGKAFIESLKINSKKKLIKETKAKDRKIKQDLDVSGAMRLADTYFSRYVRLFYSINGKCTCYTCGTIKGIKEVDNGHYQKREHKSTRYHVNNCRPQCKICNGDTKHNGKQDVFRVNLSYEIGEKTVLEIERLAKTTVDASSVFYRDIADKYRIKLNELQKSLKVKLW